MTYFCECHCMKCGLGKHDLCENLCLKEKTEVSEVE